MAALAVPCLPTRPCLPACLPPQTPPASSTLRRARVRAFPRTRSAHSPSLTPLRADPTGELYAALGFSPGFAPDVQISPYAKLLPMLAGIGSPGTIQEASRALPVSAPLRARAEARGAPPTLHPHACPAQALRGRLGSCS